MSWNETAHEVHDFEVNNIGGKWVVTDSYGFLLEASREAAHMFNLTVTGLRRRQLLVFFGGEREQWHEALRAAACGRKVDRKGTFRPRDRRPLLVRVEITRARNWPYEGALLWTFAETESFEAVAS